MADIKKHLFDFMFGNFLWLDVEQIVKKQIYAQCEEVTLRI